MKLTHVAVLCAAVAFAAHQFGYSSGIRDCPEQADLNRLNQERLDREVAALMLGISGQDETCSKIFNLVQEQVEEDVLLDQSAQQGLFQRD